MSTLRLGIDTGGTYTDAVLLAESGSVVCTGKSLTTHHSLSHGINNALNQLPAEKLDHVSLVSLSTTLATNAVVEGRGTPVCLLLAGYNTHQVNRAQLEKIVRGGYCEILTGGHNASGVEQSPLDLEAARKIVEARQDDVASFGISSMFAVRNPEHELALQALVRSVSNKPVTCGHELASRLDAPRRALTVAFNASLIPYIDELIRAIESILESRQIRAPLMMVKGDGSLISASAALQRPVETILSGPAASVMGAAQISRHDNAIIADMGGTTTDIAIVTDGRPVISAEATVIGDWRPMVEAVRVFSIGLGGDSEARFQGGVGLAIGPRRVVPMSLLAHHYPDILKLLQIREHAPVSPRSIRFAVPLFAESSQRLRFTEDEKEVWQRLTEGPVDLEALANSDRSLARAAARLVRDGIAIYSGFTPTDAAHVLGKSNHWSTQASKISAVIWAKQMRQIYGWGQFTEEDPVGPSEAIEAHVIKAICSTLVSACLATDPNATDEKDRNRTAQIFSDWITGTSNIDSGLFSLKVDTQRTLVAVGAPANLYYPAVAEKFDIQLALPIHGSVANAIGAVASSVVQRAQITITQPSQGVFRVFLPEGPEDYPRLSKALDVAERAAHQIANERAQRAGASEIRVISHHDLDEVDDPDSESTVFFEARVTAVASGRPAIY